MTGEGFNLSIEEKSQLCEMIFKQPGHKEKRHILNISSMSQYDLNSMVELAQSYPFNEVMFCPSPYYKLTETHITNCLNHIKSHLSLPVMFYHIPSRSGVDSSMDF